MSVLALEDVTKVYGTGRVAVRALDGVSLTVDEGELVIVMGPSGSGKTTLLQILGALLTPTAGQVRLRGRSLAALDARALARVRLAEIGFTFQSFNLFASLSARDNVALPAALAGASRRARRVRAGRWLERLGLADRADHLPEELSGGEKQRVAIARALVNDPPLVLADEPTANLDAASGYQALHLLEQIAREDGKTVVVVTHDHRITDAADRLLWLADGRLRRRDERFATAVDPVCGMEIVAERAAATRRVDGATYWLCSQLCAERFDAAPHEYLHAASVSERSPQWTA
jgi:putative ABC transport system ATP-binding protein